MEQEKNKKKSFWNGYDFFDQYLGKRHYPTNFSSNFDFKMGSIEDPFIFLKEFQEETFPAFFIGNFPKNSLSNLKIELGDEEFEKEKGVIYKLATSNEENVDNLLSYLYCNHPLKNRDPFGLIEKNKKDLINSCSDNFACEFISKIPREYENLFRKDLPEKDLKLMFNRFPLVAAPHFYTDYGDVDKQRDFWEFINPNKFYQYLEVGFSLEKAVNDFNSLKEKHFNNSKFANNLSRKISLNGEASYDVLSEGKKDNLFCLGTLNLEILDSSATNYFKCNNILKKYKTD